MSFKKNSGVSYRILCTCIPVGFKIHFDRVLLLLCLASCSIIKFNNFSVSVNNSFLEFRSAKMDNC